MTEADAMLSVPAHWPPYLPRHLVKPDTTLHANLEVAALRYPERVAIGFFGRDIRYAEFKATAQALAGWLQRHAGFARGERAALFMQNCPQWSMAYYGVQRADGVCVPANPMYKADELRAVLEDSGATVLVCGAELLPQALQAAHGTTVRHVLVTAYADYLPEVATFELPAWIHQPVPADLPAIASRWTDVIAAGHLPAAAQAAPDDLAVINYTSGSTGGAKGCMHTHRTHMHTMVGLSTWHGHPPGTVFLGVAPMYQVAGLTVGVHCAVYTGGTVVPLPRWDRRLAARLIRHYQVHFAGIAPAAIIDMLADPALQHDDLASLRRVSFGGATMPDAVWRTLDERLGLQFIEAYGMTETAATTHINPVHRPRRQCAGLPFFDTEALIVDPATGQPCPDGTAGEIVVRGPQIFQGYWGRPAETAEAFIEIAGQRYFRSGDIGLVDDEGYLHITDRLKRMINASGFKVWPAEVENLLYGHPAVQEACVIGARDGYRGETVKAVVVLRESHRGRIGEHDLVAWSRERLAAYKYPRIVQFVDSLPKSPVGKVLWRELQEAESARTPAAKP
ncbi:long-chain-fatty-acid--CoA ligase [Pseudorhodoferax sp.]|uniref:long-chain-fatty-acid--CoA ligase n=1 Tax=Pseudorhodoferax sp. TaxID=1993553 RepID=UPI002DD64F1E|nr:long-chain-fatty-acid--CoA ligase [Pseudorhodoferax sp.]